MVCLFSDLDQLLLHAVIRPPPKVVPIVKRYSSKGGRATAATVPYWLLPVQGKVKKPSFLERRRTIAHTVLLVGLSCYDFGNLLIVLWWWYD